MMRNIKSRKWLADKFRSRNGETPQLPPLQASEITPSSGWTEDSSCHYLLLELPDFKQEEIKLQFESPDLVKISGERREGDKTIYFDKTYAVHDHADMERTSSKLESGIFTVTIPKPIQEIISSEKTNADKEFQEIGNSNEDDSKKESNGTHVDEDLKDQDSNSDRNPFSSNAVKMICNSKNTIFMTLIAFCLGVLVSRKMGQ